MKYLKSTESEYVLKVHCHLLSPFNKTVSSASHGYQIIDAFNAWYSILCTPRCFQTNRTLSSLPFELALSFYSYQDVLAFRAPLTASRSAASLPTLLECPLIHSKSVRAWSFSRSSVFVRMFSTRSLFSTGFPAAVRHPFFLQLMYQFVTQSMAYLLSVIMLASLLRGIISRARRIAVSSAR